MGAYNFINDFFNDLINELMADKAIGFGYDDQGDIAVSSMHTSDLLNFKLDETFIKWLLWNFTSRMVGHCTLIFYNIDGP